MRERNVQCDGHALEHGTRLRAWGIHSGWSDLRSRARAALILRDVGKDGVDVSATPAPSGLAAFVAYITVQDRGCQDEFAKAGGGESERRVRTSDGHAGVDHLVGGGRAKGKSHVV